MPKAAAWFVYMLECDGDRIYTGITPDVDARFAAHCAGRGGAFTRSFPPRRVLAAKRCGSRSAALKAEHALKQLARPEKLRWIGAHPPVTTSARQKRTRQKRTRPG